MKNGTHIRGQRWSNNTTSNFQILNPPKGPNFSLSEAMAFRPLRIRRVLSLLEHSVHGYKPLSFLSAARLLPSTTPALQFTRRSFTSSTTLFLREFNPETDEIGPDTILFEGCDYNHWLITVDFPKDSSIPREQMIETYINIATQVFGGGCVSSRGVHQRLC